MTDIGITAWRDLDTPFNTLTLDVLPLILAYVTSTSDLFSLCLTSRSVAHYARYRLYNGTLFVRPAFGSRPNDTRQYARLLLTLSHHPHLARYVRTFVVPYIEPPHERFDDLWTDAIVACAPTIRSFRWRSTLPIPPTVLSLLESSSQSLPSLRNLSLLAQASVLPTPQHVKALARIEGLREIELLAPDRSTEVMLIDWINGMSDTLVRLHIEDCDWLDASSFLKLRLPNLRHLTLYECPELTALAVLPLLRSAAVTLESLYLGLPGVKIAELVRPEDRLPSPSFPRLTGVSLMWERSLAFWIHAQTLLEPSPIEVFHVIRTSTAPTPGVRTATVHRANNANVNNLNAPAPNGNAPAPAPAQAQAQAPAAAAAAQAQQGGARRLTLTPFAALLARRIGQNPGARLELARRAAAQWALNNPAPAGGNVPVAARADAGAGGNANANVAPAQPQVEVLVPGGAAPNANANAQGVQAADGTLLVPHTSLISVTRTLMGAASSALISVASMFYPPIAWPSSTSSSTPSSFPIAIPDSFIHHFASTHQKTLRTFWAAGSGLTCSEEAVKDMCVQCGGYRLEKVRVGQVEWDVKMEQSSRSSMSREDDHNQQTNPLADCDKRLRAWWWARSGSGTESRSELDVREGATTPDGSQQPALASALSTRW